MPQRSNGLPAVNSRRRAEKYRRNFAGPVAGLDFGEWIRRQPCLVYGCQRTDIQAAHVLRARGMGGCNGDWRDLGPLCVPHHRRFDSSARQAMLEEQGGLFYSRLAVLIPAWIVEHGLEGVIDARGNVLDQEAADAWRASAR